ncbi:MAG: MFS transporter [Lachnospiraceae bacterium]|nr:MFS transporter [Lachnospiraceae bacterium]
MKKTNKHTSMGMTLGMCFGVSLGISLGSSVGNVAMGSSMGMLFGMVIGLLIGAAKDREINNQIEEKGYTIKDIKKNEQSGEYIITIVNRLGEENVVNVPKGQMEEENFSNEDVVYLDEDGMLEQAYYKEDE